MKDCTHEEADTHIMLHVYIASQCGHQKVMTRTIDKDVDELWIAFGTSKHFRYLAIHDIAAQLGPQKAKVLRMLHALTGSTLFPSFLGKTN